MQKVCLVSITKTNQVELEELDVMLGLFGLQESIFPLKGCL